MSVYFVSARELDLVKIGYAFDPVRRYNYLRICCPVELTLEGAIPGGYDKERELHKQFALARVRGEWFKPCPEIEALLATTKPPSKPRSLAQKKRLLAMHVDTRWSDKKSEKIRPQFAADIHFPFRVKEDA